MIHSGLFQLQTLFCDLHFGGHYMPFVTYQMFVIQKIAKNGITCSKNNEWPVPFGNCYEKFHYYRMFTIRNFVLFALRYSLLGIICYSLCRIWYYMLKLYKRIANIR